MLPYIIGFMLGLLFATLASLFYDKLKKRNNNE